MSVFSLCVFCLFVCSCFPHSVSTYSTQPLIINPPHSNSTDDHDHGYSLSLLPSDTMTVHYPWPYYRSTNCLTYLHVLATEFHSMQQYENILLPH